ncbi:phosphoglycerate mutase family protein [Cardiosporidium cionae]|uniref:phosphoglycerate mutase (2,3-diphosphoglycerate-dependent) n=1 Tax=Cardiosporidium cionae TaxID=476202 RepID=A0ABQ7JEK8_9APIC|nr:phosphoglycerate mutase family protein [Cardiosporidium cionae]|eukprot:KAF8822330.1 phosphoglycerate mutase family protein [Cardiosporidium cionae]
MSYSFSFIVLKMHRNMPIDLVLVRHGQSEGNLAQRLSRQGNSSSIWKGDFRERHNSLYRLTDRGRWQANIAGEWIRCNISTVFDKYFTSEYIRAMETAAMLNLPNARWATETYLRERDRGVLANKSHVEREKHFSEELRRKRRDDFYWQPSGGESIANLCLRVDRVMEILCENCSGLRVIIVCHGGVMKSFRALIERRHNRGFSIRDKIHNCQIFWYTRRDPATGVIASKYNWMQSVCPWDLKRSANSWKEIQRLVYTNEELLRSVECVPQLINHVFESNNQYYNDEWSWDDSECSDGMWVYPLELDKTPPSKLRTHTHSATEPVRSDLLPCQKTHSLQSELPLCMEASVSPCVMSRIPLINSFLSDSPTKSFYISDLNTDLFCEKRVDTSMESTSAQSSAVEHSGSESSRENLPEKESCI